MVLGQRRHARAVICRTSVHGTTAAPCFNRFMSDMGSFTIQERLQAIQRAFLDARARFLDDESVVRIQGTLDLLSAALDLEPPLPFVDRGTPANVHLGIDEHDTQRNLVALVTALESGEADDALYSCRQLDDCVADYLVMLHDAHGRVSSMGNTTVDVPFMSAVTQVGRQLRQLRDTDTLSSAAGQISEMQTEMSQILDNARNASGAIAEMKLAERFTKLHGDERQTADRFRISTIVFLALGILGSIIFYIVNQFFVEDADPVKVAYNAIIIGAIFGFSGYFARQAKHHRDLSDWGHTISVQLLTFNAFMDGVDNAGVRDTARIAFANRVFGAGPQTAGADTSVQSAALLEQILPLLRGSK